MTPVNYRRIKVCGKRQTGFFALALCGPIFAIIAGIKANEGKEYKYPYSFNLIK